MLFPNKKAHLLVSLIKKKILRRVPGLDLRFSKRIAGQDKNYALESPALTRPTTIVGAASNAAGTFDVPLICFTLFSKKKYQRSAIESKIQGDLLISCSR